MMHVFALLLGLGAAFAVSLNARALALRFGLMDMPDPVGGRKRHDIATPLVGGLAVISSTVTILVAVAWIGQGSGGLALHLGWMAFAVGTMFAIGLIDDRFGLSPRLRLVVAVLVFGVAALSAPDLALSYLRFSWLDTPVFLGGLGVAFTILCLVGLLNAVNMADGKNGVVIGFSLIWTIFLSAYAPPPLMPVLLALGAGLTVIFIFNLKGRLFLGDGGSYGLSCLFGLLFIYVFNFSFDRLTADMVALWLAVPVLDCIRVMLMRIANKRSPFAGDRDHLHHYLHRTLPWGWGLSLYLGLVFIPGGLAILSPDATLALLACTLLAYAATVLVTSNPSLARTKI
jgi:UDP-GlcNAc:undecaprenyl-phosphate/decaprenyl-phosphate GlcNAc-1-phosphate transferase